MDVAPRDQAIHQGRPAVKAHLLRADLAIFAPGLASGEHAAPPGQGRLLPLPYRLAQPSPEVERSRQADRACWLCPTLGARWVPWEAIGVSVCARPASLARWRVWREQGAVLLGTRQQSRTFQGLGVGPPAVGRATRRRWGAQATTGASAGDGDR